RQRMLTPEVRGTGKERLATFLPGRSLGSRCGRGRTRNSTARARPYSTERGRGCQAESEKAGEKKGGTSALPAGRGPRTSPGSGFTWKAYNRASWQRPAVARTIHASPLHGGFGRPGSVPPDAWIAKPGRVPRARRAEVRPARQRQLLRREPLGGPAPEHDPRPGRPDRRRAAERDDGRRPAVRIRRVGGVDVQVGHPLQS